MNPLKVSYIFKAWCCYSKQYIIEQKSEDGKSHPHSHATIIQSVSNFRSGLINKFGELIEEHGPHGDIDFASRINLDLYLDDKAVCKRGKLALK